MSNKKKRKTIYVDLTFLLKTLKYLPYEKHLLGAEAPLLTNRLFRHNEMNKLAIKLGNESKNKMLEC